MGDHLITIGILVVANIPLYLFIGKLVFDDWEGFGEAIGFLFSPDILDLLNGERGDDFFAKMKIAFFLIVCGGAVYGEFYLIHKHFLN